MKRTIQIQLEPLGTELSVVPGAALQDALFAAGVEFPCGGRGQCKGCRVKVLAGQLPVTPEDAARLTAAELLDGWRLACRARPAANLKLELAQWEAAILGDQTPFAFTPRAGLGIAVDLGTTTIVAQLLDLQTGHVLGVRTGLNQQARHGADIMSRVEYAAAGGGQGRLTALVRRQIGALVAELSEDATRRRAVGPPAELRQVVIVGNTVMHHLFCGVPVAPLAYHPFEPVDDGLKAFSAAELGWSLPGSSMVRFLPCLGGFVGSDILAGILATGLHRSERLTCLLDLGTNGEIVLGNRDRLLCASTAAGPAFEGARISMGMRAATGAIAAVAVQDGALRCRVLGHGPPRGLCGTGLVDAVAAGLDLGWILPSGRLAQQETIPLAQPVTLTRADIRELQLAKGAIAAGVRLLLDQWGAQESDVTLLHLAGAFGNYINRASARRIGLVALPLDRVRPAGNTALLGAKLVLFGVHGQDESFAALRARIRHVPLNEDPRFHEVYVAQMQFPG